MILVGRYWGRQISLPAVVLARRRRSLLLFEGACGTLALLVLAAGHLHNLTFDDGLHSKEVLHALSVSGQTERKERGKNQL